jgi:uncharacterized iron-regulated membrane protein
MKRFRQILFWCHLGAGVIAGTVIGLLCLTGVALTFEKDLIAWSERDARRVTPPASAVRLSLAEMQTRLQAAQPDFKPTAIVVSQDPHAAVAFNAGRSGGHYVNPYTGEVRQPQSTAMAGFMQTMVGLHRYLGFTGETSRPNGKLVTGISNLAFLFLAISGLYLWLPRSWSWRALRPGVWFTQNSSARARDWHWHHVIGFWCAPVLIGLTLTALPISFRWAGELTYTLTGTPLPAKGPESSGAPPPTATVPPAPADAAPLTPDTLLASAQQRLPAWETATLRLTRQADPAKPQPATVVVREANTWPRTATTTLQFDPYTGDLLRRDGYADLSPARKIRAWTRFLHTGEALGWGAQLAAGLASLGGCFLVYTGLALAWRRFFGNTAKPRATGAQPRP